jgi:cobalt-zinc-cadmium efflux system protein
MGLDHSHTHQHSVSGKNLGFSIILNLVITIAQIIGGIISGSLALLSDAIHNLSDVISLIISYAANLLSRKKKQTKQYTFGYKRAEVLAAFINSALLIGIAAFLAFKAITRFENVQIINSNLVIWLAILGILVNGLSVLLLKRDAEHNFNMKTAYLHLLADMLTSVAVLTGGLLMKYYQIYWIDSVLTLLIAVYLIYLSWDVFISTLKILMLFSPEHVNIEEIVAEILQISTIRNVHHVHIWQLNEHDCHFEAHLEFKENINLTQFDQVCEQIENLLAQKFHIFHSNLQPEFNRDDSKEIIKQD